MLSFIGTQLLFYISIILILFIPGYFLLLTIFGRKDTVIGQLERLILSFGLSLVIVDFIAFFYSKINIPITAFSSIFGITIFSLICLALYKSKKIKDYEIKETAVFNFSNKQLILILSLLFLTFFIKTAYLTSTVTPTATDMGHHMYWAKEMTETHKLPTYEGMPDFIIGEHIAIAEVAMISGSNFFSAFPVVFLLLINILGILTVFILTLRIFKNNTIAILTLLFLGVLFAISSPQAKFVSGGVVGNIFGNFLMPLAFYFYFRAFSNLKEKNSEKNKQEKQNHKISIRFLSLAFFITFGLFYTHHLTAFIFIFIFVLLILIFLAVNYKDVRWILKKINRIIFSLPVILTFIFGLIFFFFIFTPNYVKTSAVNTAVGTPSKATREGLSLTNIKSSIGEARLALGIVGLFLLILSYKKKNFGFTLVSAWAIMLFLMSTRPDLIFINLPSSRIGNYLTYPFSILSAFGLYSIFNPNFTDSKKVFPQKFLSSAFIIILIFVLTDGLRDNAYAFKKTSDMTPILKTFSASNYLKANITDTDIILKDHNYIPGDSWMKIFFMQGYKYPQSRGYFKRYEDPTKPREMCTLYMISNPNGEEALKCFSETKTNYIVVNPKYDSSQFKKLNNFNAVYNNGDVAIYNRK